MFERLLPSCQMARGVVLALPGLFSPTQASYLSPLADKARFPLLGSVRTPLAAAHTAFAADPWSGPALVFDIDDHALIRHDRRGGRRSIFGCKTRWCGPMPACGPGKIGFSMASPSAAFTNAAAIRGNRRLRNNRSMSRWKRPSTLGVTARLSSCTCKRVRGITTSVST